MVSKTIRFLILSVLVSVCAYFAFGAESYRIDRLYHFLGLYLTGFGGVYLVLALLWNTKWAWAVAGLMMPVGLFFYGAYAGIALLSAAAVVVLLGVFYKAME